MATRTITYTGELVVVGGCWNCGSNCAIPRNLYRQAKENGNGWYCPGCGQTNVYKTTEVQTLKAERARLEGQVAEERQRTRIARADADRNEARRRAEKAAKTRLKNRIAKGICPCCKRHFANVHRHITSQHPEFVIPEEGD